MEKVGISAGGKHKWGSDLWKVGEAGLGQPHIGWGVGLPLVRTLFLNSHPSCVLLLSFSRDRALHWTCLLIQIHRSKALFAFADVLFLLRFSSLHRRDLGEMGFEARGAPREGTGGPAEGEGVGFNRESQAVGRAGRSPVLQR